MHTILAFIARLLHTVLLLIVSLGSLCAFGISNVSAAPPHASIEKNTRHPLSSLHHPVPGGIAVIALGTSTQAPRVTFNLKPVLVMPDAPGQWSAIIGLTLTTPTGDHHIQVNRDTSTNKKTEKIIFNVQDKKYKEQRLTIKNTRQVNPLAEDLTRINIELDLQNKAYQQFSRILPSNVVFDKPVDGPLSSPFGLKRFFNGEPRAPHSGLDFAVPTSTPIKAPAAGKVLLTGDYFFNGLTVFLDHGQGLISMYCHLSVIDVKVGDTVKRGEILGKVGATGRVTGAHLHWNVSLNDARVDPAILIGMFKP